MFSPIVAMALAIASDTVPPPRKWAPSTVSTSAAGALSSATATMPRTSAWKSSLRATKSVSELTSTTTPTLSSTAMPTSPSAATRPLFLAALARPFLRSQSTAASMSPSVSLSAFLQSIIPAPVFSRRSLTSPAVIVAIDFPRALAAAPRARRQPYHPPCVRTGSHTGQTDAYSNRRLLGGHQGAGLIAPLVPGDAAVELEVGVKLAGFVGGHRGELPIVEHAVFVEFLLDLGTDAGDLGQIVRCAPRSGQEFEVFGGGFGLGLGDFRQRLGDRRFRFAYVDAMGALAARNAVDGGARDEIAIELNGAPRVVIRRHRKGDAVRVAVGVEDRDHRDLEAVRLLDRQRLLVGVDDEHEVGDAAHILDAAERSLELFALARQHQPLFLGQALGALAQHLVELAQARDRGGNGLPVRQHPPEPAGIDEVLRRALGRVRDFVGGLALGPDEQDPPALGDCVGNRLQRLVQKRHRLGEVDDMDGVAGAVDVGRHLRIPAMRLVAEMGARLEELAHGEIRQCHWASLSG